MWLARNARTANPVTLSTELPSTARTNSRNRPDQFQSATATRSNHSIDNHIKVNNPRQSCKAPSGEQGRFFQPAARIEGTQAS